MRLDQALVDLGHFPSRARAGRAIKEGAVFIDGQAATKPAAPYQGGEVTINDPTAAFVSRGALKLQAILGDVAGMVALDLGASTGGFTQVLLNDGAKCVFAVDVGRDQMAKSLRGDKRVILREGFNVRDLAADSFSHPLWPHFQVVVADLSFISLRKAFMACDDLCAKGVTAYLLVKPQFELEPADIGKGGLVKTDALRQKALHDVCLWLESRHWVIETTMNSPIKGGDGNTEYLVKARKT